MGEGLCPCVRPWDVLWNLSAGICGSSRSVWKMLTDTGWDFGCPCRTLIVQVGPSNSGYSMIP